MICFITSEWVLYTTNLLCFLIIDGSPITTSMYCDHHRSILMEYLETIRAWWLQLQSSHSTHRKNIYLNHKIICSVKETRVMCATTTKISPMSCFTFFFYHAIKTRSLVLQCLQAWLKSKLPSIKKVLTCQIVWYWLKSRWTGMRETIFFLGETCMFWPDCLYWSGFQPSVKQLQKMVDYLLALGVNWIQASWRFFLCV